MAENSTAKILIFDIETAPKISYVWRFFKENVGVDQVLHHGHVMSFAAKWLDEDDIYYHENRGSDDSNIIEAMCGYLDRADIVVAHNGERFDSPQVIGRALVHGLSPPSPYKMVDTCKVARKEFGFPSNSLAYIAKVLGCDEKSDHKKFPGFKLWLECLKGNDEAWEEMAAYNIQDVETLEEVYLRMRPYIKNHPNVGVFSEEAEAPTCNKCGSTHLHRRGYAYTNVGKYPRYQCQDCGGWSRGRYTELKKSPNLLANVTS